MKAFITEWIDKRELTGMDEPVAEPYEDVLPDEIYIPPHCHDVESIRACIDDQIEEVKGKLKRYTQHSP